MGTEFSGIMLALKDQSVQGPAHFLSEDVLMWRYCIMKGMEPLAGAVLCSVVNM
jgi:hypothetical protein